MYDARQPSDKLQSLGIEEVRERLELSNLTPIADQLQTPDIDKCCCCKINPDPTDSPAAPSDGGGEDG